MVKIDNVNQLPHLYIETLTNKLIHIYSRDEKNIFCIQLSSDKLIDEYNLLNDKGLIICESDSIDKIIYPDNYKCLVDKKYGDKYIVILEKIW